MCTGHSYSWALGRYFLCYSMFVTLIPRNFFSWRRMEGRGSQQAWASFTDSILSGSKYVKMWRACLCKVCSLCPETGESSCHVVPASGFRYNASPCVRLYQGKQNKVCQKLQRTNCQRSWIWISFMYPLPLFRIFLSD
jgi:hypothetical protein